MASKVPPGPPGHWLLGNLRAYQADPLSWLREAATYGDVVRWRFGPFPVIQLNHPETVRQVLVEQAGSFFKTRLTKQVFQDTFGDGLVFSDGEFWRRQRRLVAPAFHPRRIDEYGRVMVDYTQRMLDGWNAGERRDLGREMMALTLRIVAKTLFDADIESEIKAIAEQMAIGQELGNRRFQRLIGPPSWLPVYENRERWRFVKTLDRIIYRLIAERRESGEDKGDLLSMLLLATDEEDGSGMTDKQARDEAATLFIAGHETTANTLTWAWVLLSEHPDVEARLHAELDHVLGGRPPQVADLDRLPYTRMVVEETMRRYPPAWILARESIQPVRVGGYDFRPGSVFFISPYVLHHDPAVFPDPDRFDPERFADDVRDTLPKYAYIPFGGGPRICIGNSFALMEARLVLATMAQRIRLRLDPPQAIETDPLITLRPKQAVTMAVRARMPKTLAVA